MRRPLYRIVARGLTECGCEDDYADAVARFEGWTGPTRNHRRRVWQALAENTDRKFDAEWAAIAARVFVWHERPDLADAITGYYAQVRWDAEREREELPERRQMKMVRSGAGRRRSA